MDKIRFQTKIFFCFIFSLFTLLSANVASSATVSSKGVTPTTVYQAQSISVYCNFTSTLPSGYKVKIGHDTSTTTMVLATTDSKNYQSSFGGSSTIGSHTIYYKLYDNSGNAIQDLGTSAYTVQASPLSPPSGVSATDGTYTDKIRVSWGAVTGATSYQVHRSQNSSSGYENVGSSSSTSFDDPNATAGITYYYKVKSYNATSGASELSTSYDSGYRAVATPTVSSKGVTPTTIYQAQSISVYCNFTSTLPSGYKVKIGHDTSTTTMVLATTDSKNYQSSFGGSSTIGSHTIYYKLYDNSGNAIQDLGTSSYTVQASPLSPPSSVSATDGTYTDKVTVSWGAVTGATSYQVHRSQNSSSGYENVGSSSSTSFDDPNATAGITYYYKVKSYNATSGASELSTSYDSGYRAVATPTVSSKGVTPTTIYQGQSISVYCNFTSTLPSGYKVKIGHDTSTTTMVLATTDSKNYQSSFGGSTTIGSHTIYYKLYDNSGNAIQDLGTSAYTVQASPLSPPSGVSATDGTYTDKVRVSWGAVTGATSYQVHRSQYSSSGYENIGSPSSTSFDDTYATAGITYYYKVKSYNATAGVSELSTSYDSGYSAVATPSVSNVTPLNAILNQLTTFTVTGTNLTSGMGFTVQDCDPSNNEVGTGSSTQRTFQCTPSGTTGTKTGTVKTAPSGNFLKSFSVNVSAATLPTITVPVISTGTTLPYKFTVTASGSLPDGYYVAINFDDLKGGWLAQSSPGGHFKLTTVSGNTISEERTLDYPGIRYFRAGIFNAAGVLQGSYTTPNTCTLQSCLNAAINQADIKNLIGDPDISGSGSQLMRGVDVATGNFHHSATDMSVSSKGPDFTIVRAYNSLTTNEHWTFNIDAKASFTATNLLSIGPREDGHFQYFYKDWNDQKWYPLNPGNFDTLVQNTDGSIVLYTQGNLLYRFAGPTSAQAGRLTKIEDRDANAIVFGHDANNRITSATDASGGTYTITRNSAGRITRVTDFTGRYVEYTWDANNMITKVRNPRNQNEIYGYNVTQLTTIKDQRQNLQATITYTSGKVSAVKDGLNNTWSYQYSTDAGRQATLITRPVVNGENNNLGFILDNDRTRVLERIDSQNTNNYRSKTAYKYVSTRQRIAEMNLPVEKTPPMAAAKTTIAYKGDGRGNPIEVTKTDNGDDVSLTTYMEWAETDANKPNLTPLKKVTKPGVTSATRFDNFTASGKARTIINPRNEVSTREYSAGLLTKTTDARTNSTLVTNGTEGRGLPTRIDDATGNYTANTYDALGRVTSTRNARGYYTHYTYDENDNVTSITRPADGVTPGGAGDIKIVNTYDASDNLATTKDPRGNLTSFTYDVLNRKTEENYTVAGQPRKRRFEYDAMGRLYRAIDEKNNATESRFDARGKLLKEIDPLTQSVTYTYDGNGNVLTVTDAVGRKVTYTYDALDRKISSLDSEGNTESFEYNEQGLLKSKTDGRNQTTRYEYDVMGRMTKVIDPDNSTTQATYDANGNLATTIDRNTRTTQYSYDKLNRLSQLTDPLSRVWKFTYDPNGNLTSRIMPSGKTITYTYDKFDRLTGVNYPGGPTVSYTYDLSGNRKTMTDAQGTTSYNYDEQDRLTSVTNAFGLTVTYTYDAAGLLQQLTYPGSRNVSYFYDNANRLKSLTDWLNHTTTYTRDNSGVVYEIAYGNGAKVQPHTDMAGRLDSLVNKNKANAVISSHTLTLDGAGNPTSADVDLPLMPANLGKAAEMFYDASNRLDKVGVAAITHDTDGRVIADASGADPIAYAYNAQDLITTVTKSGVLTDTYSYDGDGRRTQRVSGSTTTRYLLDPTGGELYRLLAETDGSNAVQRYYVYGAGLVSQITGSTHHYYHFDPSGNTLALTDNNGVVSDTYAYEPFGNTTVQGTTNNPFRFVGKHGVMDDGNGLHHMRARYYRTDLRRFVSLDALYGQVDDPLSLNRYQYVSGNPMVRVDPSGKEWKEIAIDAGSEYGQHYLKNYFNNSKDLVVKMVVKGNKISLYKYHVRRYSRNFADKASQNIDKAGVVISSVSAAYFTTKDTLEACKNVNTDARKCFSSAMKSISGNAAGAAAGLYCTPSGPAGTIICSYTASYVVGSFAEDIADGVGDASWQIGVGAHKTVEFLKTDYYNFWERQGRKLYQWLN